MIVAVQGYAGKKNKSVTTAATIAAMLAMAGREKTIIFQFTNADIDNIENTYTKQIKDGGIMGNVRAADFSEAGMDPLMRYVDATKLMKADFEQYCTAMLKAENMLDVATVTKSNDFVSSLYTKHESIENLIKNAKDVYDNIVMLIPAPKNTRDKNFLELNKFLNELADVSVYCLKQGHQTEVDTLYGKKKLFVVTDHETDSIFSIGTIRKKFADGNPTTKIEHNVAYQDASLGGKLLLFIRDNLETSRTDVNFVIAQDIKRLYEMVAGKHLPKDNILDEWTSERTAPKIKSKGIFPSKKELSK